MSSFTILALAVTLACSGCGIQLRFGARPMPLPPTSNAERCYHDKRIELAGGVAESEKWKYVRSTGTHIWYRVMPDHVNGVVFYRGGERIAPATAMRHLADQALERTYRRELDRLDSGRTRHRRRVIIGTGIAAAGIGLMVAAIPADSVKLFGAGGVTSLVGLGVMATGYKHARYREQHEIYSKLLIEGGLHERLLHAVQRHNHGVARQCAYRGEVTIPMSPDLKNTLHQ